MFYNGYRANAHIKPAADVASDTTDLFAFKNPKATALGIENLAQHGAQGRGVLVDLHAHFGRERIKIGYDHLMRVLEADRVEIGVGDMVCFHTGFAEMLLEMNRNPDRRNCITPAPVWMVRTNACCNGLRIRAWLP